MGTILRDEDNSETSVTSNVVADTSDSNKEVSDMLGLKVTVSSTFNVVSKLGSGMREELMEGSKVALTVGNSVDCDGDM